ncbi:MAG TPA: hypothetical protein VJ960_09885 [Oceanipulchritudo sp.]|nr:hypothetical protein [Oceanipulchritudo sp.]
MPGLSLVCATAIWGGPSIDPYSVRGPHGEGLVEDSVVLSVYSELGTGNPMEHPPIQLRVGNVLQVIHATSHSSLWTLSEHLESYGAPWKVVAPSLASDLIERQSGHEVGWSLNGTTWYPPYLRKIDLKRYPGLVGVWDMELFTETDANGEEGMGWGWLGEAAMANARADYKIVTNSSIRKFEQDAKYPVLVPVDDALIDEGRENPDPWKRIYDGIGDMYRLDDTRLLTANHSEHANSMATRPNFTFKDSVYLKPPRFFELERTATKIPEAGFYDIAVCETEIYNNLFRPDYAIEYDPVSMTYDPMTYGYANPVFFFYKQAGDEGEHNRYAWHQGLDWSNYYSFVTINIINLDSSGRYVDTVDHGPVVWPTGPYLNTNGTRRTRGVRSPRIVIREEDGDPYIYLFYSELIGQEYEEAVEMGQPNPPETYPEIKLARARLNPEPGTRPFGTFEGYAGDDENGDPIYATRMDPVLNATALRRFLEDEPWDLDVFRDYMKKTAEPNHSLTTFTGYQPARKWEWELDTMTYTWEALWTERSDYGGVNIARIKDSDLYLSVQQVSYGGRPDGNITYETPRKYWRWVGSSSRPYEEILNGPSRLLLRVSKDLVHWSDPVVLNPGQLGNVWTRTGRRTFTYYQSLVDGFNCYATEMNFQITDLPEYLLGKGCIQVPFEDRRFTGREYLNFRAAGSLMVYVAFDARHIQPGWLESWTVLDETVTVSVGNESHEMRLYEKAFDGEHVTLGGNGHEGLMYAVFFDMGITSMNYPRFLSSDGATNREIDLDDFYIIGSKPLLYEPEDADALEQEGNVRRLGTGRLRMSLQVDDRE